MYKKTGLYALLLSSAWLGPVVLFHGLNLLTDYYHHSQAYLGFIIPVITPQDSYQIKLSALSLEPLISCQPQDYTLVAQTEKLSGSFLEQPLGLNSFVTDTYGSSMQDVVNQETIDSEPIVMDQQLQEVAQQLRKIEEQLLLNTVVIDEPSIPEVDLIIPEPVIVPVEVLRELPKEPEIVSVLESNQILEIKKSKKQIKFEKQEERKARKAAAKAEQEQQRLQKQFKKQSYKAKRRKIQEQQEQKLLMKQVAKEHKQKAVKTARATINYQDSNLVKKQVQQKIALVQLQVDDLYTTVFKLTDSVTLSELLALLRLLIIQKKEYALVHSQVVALVSREAFHEIQDELRGLEFRIKTPLEKIRDRLYLLFGSITDPQLGQQYCMNQQQQELSDSMQEMQELLQLQLITIGKEGLQEYTADLVQQELSGLQQEYQLLQRTIATQAPLLEQSRKQDFNDQMKSVLTQKERAIQSVKTIYKDMVPASKLK